MVMDGRMKEGERLKKERTGGSRRDRLIWRRASGLALARDFTAVFNMIAVCLSANRLIFAVARVVVNKSEEYRNEVAGMAPWC